MLDLIVSGFVFLLTCVIVFHLLRSRKPKEKHDYLPKIPGLDPSDKLGNFNDIEKEGSLHSFLKKLHERFGPIAAFWFGQDYIVSLASPELFKDHLKLYNRPGVLFETFKPITGRYSIQYANGEEWKTRRKMYDKYFSHEMLTFYISTFTEIANDWVEKQNLLEDKTISLHDHMMGLALKSILATSFGFKCSDEEQIKQFHHLYNVVWNELESRQFGKTPTSQEEKRLNQGVETLQSFVSDIIANRKKLTDADTYIFLDYLLDNSLTDDIMMNEIITYIIGGFHTTGNLLTWIFYYLSIHPEIQEKLYNELIEILDEEPITPEKMNELTYMNQVIKESIRCSILAPYAARFSDEDVRVGDYVIPGGTPVIHALGVVLHDSNIWPEPEKFDPERFDVKQSQERASLAYSPFGFGRRACPGQKFSNFETICFMSVICRAFSVKLADDQRVVRVHGLVTHPDKEIRLTLSCRK